MPSSDHLDPLSRLSLLVFRLQQSFSQTGDTLAAPWGLTSAKWKVLGAIVLAEAPQSAANIGRAMGLSRQAAVKQANLLLEQDMLERIDNPQDARAPLFRLTALGQQAYQAVYSAWTQRTLALLEKMGSDNLQHTGDQLQNLLNHLECPL